MREQKGYVFHRYNSWFVRYWDNVLQPDGTVKRVQVCKKLDVEYGGDYRTEKSVRPFVAQILAPLNSGLLNPQSTMLVSEFVEKMYLPEYVYKKLRPATHKQYRDVWNYYLKPRMGALTLRGFRTVHGEQMLAQIAAQSKLGRSSLRHIKAFLSGAFKQAKRLGILDGINPVMDVSIPRVPEAKEDTYAYSLSEIKTMLAQLAEPARTVVLTAALTGLRKSELRGLTWENFDGKELSVTRSVWNSTVSEPKTRRSRSPIPVVKPLAEALEAHRLRAGILAQPGLPIFQAGNGQPLNLDNLARRVIAPALSRCVVCREPEAEHKTEGHLFKRDAVLPEWHAWHAFRRGLATNLHALGVDDKTIQAILRHSNVGLTMNVYVKSVSESQVSAMDALSEKLEMCNVRATSGGERPN
ncbi:MAG: site-specific integrase [Acidobacteriia bacterium]|nr:site-specific integrase [Terriglobia bacterium]